MGWELKKYPMYCGGVKQTYPNVKPGETFLSRSAVVGNIIFLSGSVGVNLETGEVASTKFEEQTVACLDNIRLALEEAGSSMENLVKNFVLLKNYEDAPRMWETMLDYYRKHAPHLVEEPPAVTVTQVENIYNPECLIEIDVIAVVSKDEPGWELKKYPMYYGDVKQVYPNIEPGMPFLSESVAVGNLLFLSAVGSETPSTGKIEKNVFEEQMDVIFEKERVAMDRPGSSMNNIIRTWHFITRVDWLLEDTQKAGYSTAATRLWKSELEHYDLYAPYLLDEPPASTFFKVSSLENPDSLVQIDLIGLLSRYKPGWEVKKYPLYHGRRGFPRHIAEIKRQYSNTVVVGNLIFISGQTPVNVYTGRIETAVFEEQVIISLDNLRAALEETGSSLDNLIKTYILIPTTEDYANMRKLELEYYRKYAPRLVDEPPASTVIRPFATASPMFSIEIDAIGFLPDR